MLSLKVENFCAAKISNAPERQFPNYDKVIEIVNLIFYDYILLN